MEIPITWFNRKAWEISELNYQKLKKNIEILRTRDGPEILRIGYFFRLFSENQLYFKFLWGVVWWWKIESIMRSFRTNWKSSTWSFQRYQHLVRGFRIRCHEISTSALDQQRFFRLDKLEHYFDQIWSRFNKAREKTDPIVL